MNSLVATISQALRKDRCTFISPGPVSLPEASLGFDKGITVRDPYGHALLLYQREKKRSRSRPERNKQWTQYQIHVEVLKLVSKKRQD